MLAIWPAKSDLRTGGIYVRQPVSHDPGELGTILRGGAVKGRAEPGIERFQVGKAIAQGNIGQSVLCQCQVVQGVLEAHTAQVFVEIHPTTCLKRVET